MEYLASEVLTKDGIVTYNTLARTQGILATQAKQVLYEFYAANKSQLQASFIVIGQPKMEDGGVISGTTTITKCDASEVDATVRALEHVEAVHVYYVSRHGVDNEQLALTESKTPLDRLAIETLGVIRNSAKLVAVAPAKGSIGDKAKPVEVKLQISGTKRPIAEVKKEKPISSLSSLSSRYVSRKSGSTGSATSSNSGNKSGSSVLSGLKYQSRKKQKSEPKERVIMADHVDEDVEMEDISSRSHANDATHSMSKLFDDLDDFDDTEENIEVAEPIIIEETKLEYPTEKKAAATLDEATKGQEKATETKDKEQEPETVSPVEYETVTIVNDEGFYETVKRPIIGTNSGTLTPTPDTAPSVTKARSPAPLTAASKRKKGQASLMSFFKPKK